MKRRTKIVLWVLGTGLGLLTLGGVVWVRTFHRYTPIEVVQDLRAGIQAHHAPRPVERFLEIRYGPLTEPANRQKAFLDFFNVGHIQGLQIITSHMQGAHRQTNIAAMAQWIAEYRQTMTQEERENLRTYLGSPSGQTAVQKATAQYLKQDVHYRAATAPVIAELMSTLAALQKP